MFSFPEKVLKVFKDENLHRTFEDVGFVIVDFYSNTEVESIIEFYKETHPSNNQKFYPSTYTNDEKYRQLIHNSILEFADKKIEELFENIKIASASFIVKQPGIDSYLHVHQDMTLVDESKFTGINIWAITTDLTDVNGTLYVLPKSNRLYPTYRGHTIRGIYDSIQEEIKDYMTPLYLKAGQAVIFDQSLIHFSPPNLGVALRIATNIFITHRTANFITCFSEKKMSHGVQQVELFLQEDDFMTKYTEFGNDIYSKPKQGKSIGCFSYSVPELTLGDLENKFGYSRLRMDTPTKKSCENQEVIQKDNRTFFEKYTPINIIREIIHRVKS